MVILNTNLISELFIRYENWSVSKLILSCVSRSFLRRVKVKHLFKYGVEMG